MHDRSSNIGHMNQTASNIDRCAPNANEARVYPSVGSSSRKSSPRWSANCRQLGAQGAPLPRFCSALVISSPD